LLDAPDAARQKALAGAMSRYAMDELPYVGWASGSQDRLSQDHHRRLAGLAPYPWSGQTGGMKGPPFFGLRRGFAVWEPAYSRRIGAVGQH